MSGKEYFSKSEKEEWDKVSKMSDEELIQILENEWNQLSGYEDSFLALKRLRKRLGLPVGKIGDSFESYVNGGYPKDEIFEVPEIK